MKFLVLTVLGLHLGTSSASAMSSGRPELCRNDRAYEERRTGLESTAIVSSLAVIPGFIFFAGDSARSGKAVENVFLATLFAVPGFLMPIALSEPCRRDSEPTAHAGPEAKFVEPFASSEEAIAYRRSRIGSHSLILGANLASLTGMLLMVNDKKSKIGMGASLAIPIAMALVNLSSFTAEREDSRLAVGPIAWIEAGRTTSGLAIQAGF